MELFTVLLLGFALGIKHALEPDHIIAVSTIASRSRNLFRSTLAGVFWGCGHAATLFIAGVFLIGFKASLSDKWSMSLEFAVGIMLVYLGINSLVFIGKKRVHKVKESGDSRLYLKSSVIGFIHGLAGSGAMVLLSMSAVHTEWEGILYVVVFGTGTIVSMLAFTSLIGIPVVLSKTNGKASRNITRISGVVSVLFGIYYMYNLGVTEGLFRLWNS